MKWLATTTSKFSELDTQSLGPWLRMAKEAPKQTTKAVHKICFEAKAIEAAEARALGWADESVVPVSIADNVVHCKLCDFHGTRVQVQCHEQRVHGTISDITRCVDTSACTVCGLLFESVVICRRHSRESSICNFNLLRRGPFLTAAELAASLDDDAAIKVANCKVAKAALKTSKVCTRTFGPHQLIFNKDGVVIQPSAKGHPLGNGRPLFLPRHLCEVSEVCLEPCEATRYKPCTDQCRLCGAAPHIFSGPFRSHYW